MENHGVDPDILIDNDPVKEQLGEDQQLNKAIEVILQELKDRKPLPPVPAPRTYKDLGWNKKSFFLIKPVAIIKLRAYL